MKRPYFLYLLCLVHLFLGVNAFYGGSMLLLKTDGSLLGMNTDWLQQSPFKTYLIPGIFLFVFMGLFPLVILFGLLVKPRWRWANTVNIYSKVHWAWTYSLFSGIIVITWITVQQVLTGYFWIQSLILFTGLLIIVFTLTPSVMTYYQNYELKNQ